MTREERCLEALSVLAARLAAKGEQPVGLLHRRQNITVQLSSLFGFKFWPVTQRVLNSVGDLWPNLKEVADAETPDECPRGCVLGAKEQWLQCKPDCPCACHLKP